MATLTNAEKLAAALDKANEPDSTGFVQVKSYSAAKVVNNGWVGRVEGMRVISTSRSSGKSWFKHIKADEFYRKPKPKTKAGKLAAALDASTRQPLLMRLHDLKDALMYGNGKQSYVAAVHPDIEEDLREIMPNA